MSADQFAEQPVENTEQPQQEQPQQESSSFDPSLFEQRFEQMSQSQQEMLAALQELRQGQQPEEEPEPEWDLSDPDLDPEQAQQALQQMIQREAAQQAQQAITPWIREQEARALEQKYPDLQNPEKAREVLGYAQSLASQRGMEHLAQEPWFVEVAYKAMLADQRAAQETPARQQEVPIEGGGAVPVQPEEDPVQGIVNAGSARSIWT